MESFKDLLFSIKDWFKDRANNPLFAAFFFAWLALNWRIVLIAVSDMSAIGKIRLIDQNFFPSWWHWTYYGFVSPLVLAMVYVRFSPPVFRSITVYHRKHQHLSKTAIFEADNIEPISPEEANRLKQERIDARLALKTAKERFSALEFDLLEQIQLLNTSLASKTQENVQSTKISDSKQDTGKTTEEVYSEVSKIASILSDEAKRLLLRVCEANDGLVSVTNTINGRIAEIGKDMYLPGNSGHRAQAIFDSALSELAMNKLIINVSGTLSYKLTKLAYDVYDYIVRISEAGK